MTEQSSVGGRTQPGPDRATEDLALQASLLDSIIEQSPHSLWIADETGTMLRMNQACRDLLDVRDEEVIGRYNVLHDNIVEASGHMPDVRAVFDQGVTARFELRYDSARLEPIELENPVSKVLEVTISPVRDADGGVVRAVVQHVDVTDREQALAEVRAQRGKLQAIFQSSPVGIYVSRAADGMVLDANAAFCAIFGRTRDQIIGHTSTELGAFAGAGARAVFVRRLEEDGYADAVELELPGPEEGATRTLLMSAASLEIDGDDAFVGTLLDITRRKQLEQDLASLAGDLERRVEERTAELRDSIAEIESFAYSVSHDLRAPLRHISGYAGMLADDYGAALDEQAHGYIDDLSRSVREMGVLIDELLEFSRVGRAALQVETVDMAGLVRDARRELEGDANGQEVDWRVGPLPAVRGDEVMLRQVWRNLLSNALKYSRFEERPRIEVGATEAGDEIVFTVRDNGVGFDMEYADQLFSVFQRLHGDARFEGVGIGLANVRRIVARHGGRTWGEGVEGEGATFGFSLPREGPLRDAVR